MILTECELRANWYKNKVNVLTVPPGSVLTPSARDFLRSKGIRLQVEGEGVLDFNRCALSTASQTVARNRTEGDVSPGTVYAGNESSNPVEDVIPASDSKPQKPEHMTHRSGGHLVLKNHPVIAWRGQLDLFDCLLVETQAALVREGESELASSLEEIALFAQKLMAAEVRNVPIEVDTLLGWTLDEIREMSHYPDRYFGTPHTTMSYKDGVVQAKLHSLRAKIREVELYANRAFCENGNCERPDILLVLNRLSSLFYVLICKMRGEKRLEKILPVGISNRHIHLSQEHLECLFGAGYSLHKWKELSQPGQFAAEEQVTIVGPKGRIERVRILGPLRKETQVEVSATDTYILGISPAVRDSGQLEGTSGLRLIGPRGSVEMDRGAIVAARHLHIDPEQAKAWGLHNGQRVKARIETERPVIFDEVLVRVHPDFRCELHLDTDEANAAMAGSNTRASLMGV